MDKGQGFDLGEFGGETQPTLLSWRDDAESSLSDYTVRVKHHASAEGDAAKLYHCHRVSLATGLRASEYFARMFHSGLSAEEPLVMHESAYEAFPALLDFMSAAPAARRPPRRAGVPSLSDIFTGELCSQCCTF